MTLHCSTALGVTPGTGLTSALVSLAQLHLADYMEDDLQPLTYSGVPLKTEVMAIIWYTLPYIFLFLSLSLSLFLSFHSFLSF